MAINTEVKNGVISFKDCGSAGSMSIGHYELIDEIGVGERCLKTSLEHFVKTSSVSIVERFTGSRRGDDCASKTSFTKT